MLVIYVVRNELSGAKCRRLELLGKDVWDKWKSNTVLLLVGFHGHGDAWEKQLGYGRDVHKLRTFVNSSTWENLWSGAVVSKTISCCFLSFHCECFDSRNTSSSSVRMSGGGDGPGRNYNNQYQCIQFVNRSNYKGILSPPLCGTTTPGKGGRNAADNTDLDDERRT